MTEKPDMLFTAPYRLCEGDCDGQNNNLALVFPLYVGKKGIEEYKKVYSRDFKIIRSTKSSQAPFMKRTTRHSFTLCPYKNENFNTDAITPLCLCRKHKHPGCY